MRTVKYEEEGVAAAVGAIFAILIFVFILSLFVSSYVPAEMTSYEEQYSSGVMNDLLQLTSTLSLLSLNYQQGESASVTFDLQSNYVPLFTTPTTGELTLSSPTKGSSGYITVSNSSESISSGGSIFVVTENRYFVNEAFRFELSSLFYEQYGSSPIINSTLQSNFIKVLPPANGSTVLSLDLYNIQGGPVSVSPQSPFAVSITTLSKDVLTLNGNFSLTYTSALEYQFYASFLKEISNVGGLTIGFVNLGNGQGKITVNSPSPVVLNVSVLTVLLTASS